MQQPAQLRRLLLGRHLAETVKPGIQPLTLANGAVGNFSGQATISTIEPVAAQGPFKC